MVVRLEGILRGAGRSRILGVNPREQAPNSFMVLFEDSAALVGIVIAAVGTWLSIHLGDPRIDGISSILIGAVLAAVAVLLARESKELLIGERAAPELSDAIRQTVSEEPCVLDVSDIITTQMAPDQVIATLGVDIVDSLRVPEVEALIHRIETRVRERFPQLYRVFVRPEASVEVPRNLNVEADFEGV